MYYPKCRQESIVNIKQCNTLVIKESDAKTQSQ
ncbi:cysteine-rich KTR domain-containing protein [Jeotgalibaca arthritidis]